MLHIYNRKDLKNVKDLGFISSEKGYYTIHSDNLYEYDNLPKPLFVVETHKERRAIFVENKLHPVWGIEYATIIPTKGILLKTDPSLSQNDFL